MRQSKMKLEDIQVLNNDIKTIRNAEAVYSELKKNSRCDKLEFGFNVDSRFMGSAAVSVYLGGYKGFYGSSDVTSIIRINNNVCFEEAFIKALNDLRPMILQAVADNMQEMLRDESEKLLSEIDRLKSIYNEINK